MGAKVRMEAINKKLEPTKQSERYVELDVLRGIALFGILVVNMKYFSTPALYLDMLGITAWQNETNKIIDLFIKLVFEFKFVSMFSFLFGIGVAVFISRVKQKGLCAKRLMKRRLTFLLLIGLFHLFFIWYGDILTLYALVGFLLLYFIKKRQSSMLIWSFVLLTIPAVIISMVLLFGLNMNSAFKHQIEVIMHKSSYTYSEGTLSEVFLQRLIDILFIYQGYVLMVPVVLGLFLLGVYSWKSGLIENRVHRREKIIKIRNVCIVIGLPFLMLMLWANLKGGEGSTPYYMLSLLGHSVSGPALALFYISSVCLFMQRSNWQKRSVFLQKVGRMAFTNYLLQSFICTTIFYSYGFGLFGEINELQGFLLAVVIFFFQILFSHFWLKTHSMGPMETIWRKVTYK